MGASYVDQKKLRIDFYARIQSRAKNRYAIEIPRYILDEYGEIIEKIHSSRKYIKVMIEVG